MAAAGQRCNLFTPSVAAALNAGAQQARGAALRSGVPLTDVKAVRARALARAAATPCNSADLATAAARVRTAFDAWSRLTKMTFPGERAPWLADRSQYRSVQWRLKQAGRAGSVPTTFGIAGNLDRNALVAVAGFSGQQPYSARLVMRDEARAPLPWLGTPATRPLPPRSASSVILAEGKAPAEAGLLTAPATAGVAFRFPARAAEALANLDPRERFAVEFLFPGDRVVTATFEVGDFAAGRAFLAGAAPARAGGR
ncbi:MAG: hypothetical protein K1X35_06290 [Caulobacteraceae bacterium]|nr:hypothetical protein [Caulobacteraceae bacterium]